MKFKELNHVALHVRDLNKSCEFYRKALQLEPIPRPAFGFAGAWFRLGAQQELHLIGDRGEPVYSHNRGNHFALLVDDMSEWEQHFKSIGLTYLPRRTRPDGAYQIYVIDPDGHYVELCTPPGVAPV